MRPLECCLNWGNIGGCSAGTFWLYCGVATCTSFDVAVARPNSLEKVSDIALNEGLTPSCRYQGARLPAVHHETAMVVHRRLDAATCMLLWQQTRATQHWPAQQ